MPLNRDFRDLFAALNGAEARYLLVGGYAVAFHAQPRFTKDLDVWAEPSPGNASRVLDALGRFGAPLQDLTVTDLEQPGTVYQIGVPPNRIDIVTAIDGVDFAEAWPERAETTYGDQLVPIIGRRQLVKNKRASARPQDLLDLKFLEGDWLSQSLQAGLDRPKPARLMAESHLMNLRTWRDDPERIVTGEEVVYDVTNGCRQIIAERQ